MVKVKICGITQQDDLEMAVQAGADAIGFVVNVEDSPRNLPLEKAKDLIEKLPNHIDSVAVTAFNQLQKIEEMYQKLRPRFIQLHGVPLGLDCREKLPPDLRLVVAVNATSPNAIDRRPLTLSNPLMLCSLILAALEGSGVLVAYTTGT